MASHADFVESIARRIGDSCELSYRKMFGEYALYSKAKVVALICDDQLFVKPTAAGRDFIGDVVEASPYPGAKVAFLIEDRLDDGRWLTELLTLTERELPAPKPKTKKPKTKKPAANKPAAKGRR